MWAIHRKDIQMANKYVKRWTQLHSNQDNASPSNSGYFFISYKIRETSGDD